MSLPESLGAFLAQSRNLILAGNRAGGRPHLTPNWFCWDGERFYVSTTRDRVKYALFRFAAIRDKYGMKALDVDGHLRSLITDGRVLLAITPDGPPSTWTSWTSWGLGADVA